MISISISTKRSEKRKPTGERVGEEAGMDVDSRKVVRGRIGLVRCVSGRMLGYPMNLKRRMLPRFLRIGGKWEGVWESGKKDAGRGVCVGLGLLVLYLIVLKPFVLILSCSLTPQFSFSIPFPFDIYFFLYYNQSLWMQTSLPAVIIQFLR